MNAIDLTKRIIGHGFTAVVSFWMVYVTWNGGLWNDHRPSDYGQVEEALFDHEAATQTAEDIINSAVKIEAEHRAVRSMTAAEINDVITERGAYHKAVFQLKQTLPKTHQFVFLADGSDAPDSEQWLIGLPHVTPRTLLWKPTRHYECFLGSELPIRDLFDAYVKSALNNGFAIDRNYSYVDSEMGVAYFYGSSRDHKRTLILGISNTSDGLKGYRHTVYYRMSTDAEYDKTDSQVFDPWGYFEEDSGW